MARKIYTRTGDAGETGLFGGGRVRKDAARIEAIGTLDELNAAIGVVRCDDLVPEMDGVLATVQNHLFDLGAYLALPGGASGTSEPPSTALVAWLESMIDRYESGLAPLTVFILPAGTRAAANLHLARAVCRRAERCVVRLAGDAEVAGQIGAYVNRLGDLLFVLARAANAAAGHADEPWRREP